MTGGELVLEARFKVIMLYDFYGALLTNRQQEYIQAHYLEDCSITEIAEEHKVSRQAVHDAIKRAETVMSDFDKKLNLLARWEKERQLLKEVLTELENNLELINIDDCRKIVRKILADGGV